MNDNTVNGQIPNGGIFQEEKILPASQKKGMISVVATPENHIQLQISNDGVNILYAIQLPTMDAVEFAFTILRALIITPPKLDVTPPKLDVTES